MFTHDQVVSSHIVPFCWVFCLAPFSAIFFGEIGGLPLAPEAAAGTAGAAHEFAAGLPRGDDAVERPGDRRASVTGPNRFLLAIMAILAILADIYVFIHHLPHLDLLAISVGSIGFCHLPS